MVSVGIEQLLTSPSEKSGQANAGSACGMPPKRVPMVSTGRSSAAASSDSVTSATIGPGMRSPRGARASSETAGRCVPGMPRRANRRGQ